MEENKKIIEEQSEKELHPERYDESLFKRAYSAGIKLMELKEREKRRRIVVKSLLFVFIAIFTVLGICLYKNNQPLSYTSSTVWEVKEALAVENPNEPYVDISEMDLDITAQSAMAFDPDTGQIFFEKDVYTKRLIASLTKLISSMVIMDHFDLDEIITVGILPTYGEDDLYGMELEEGDQVIVENLLKMMLLSSYNDAAIAVSESIGGKNFVSLMNEKAESLGLKNTHFTNPCGLDSEDNYSTAYDLYMVVRAFLNYPTLMEIVNNETLNVEYTRDGEAVYEEIKSTNYLMGRENVAGLKTGYTEDAGACVITLYEYENGQRLVIVILNSEDRYTETEAIEEEVRNLLELPQ